MGIKPCKMKPLTNDEHSCPLAQALQDIHDIALDYDGYRTVEGLRGLIDELDKIARTALEDK